MTRLSAYPELTYRHSVPGLGNYADVWFNGVRRPCVIRADDVRGFIDVETNLIVRGKRLVHRLWGKVEIRMGNHLTERGLRNHNVLIEPGY